MKLSYDRTDGHHDARRAESLLAQIKSACCRICGASGGHALTFGVCVTCWRDGRTLPEPKQG